MRSSASIGRRARYSSLPLSSWRSRLLCYSPELLEFHGTKTAISERFGFEDGMKVALTILLALGTASCSWTLVDRRPTNWEASEEPLCDSGSGAQYADIAIAGAAFATTIVANARVENMDPESPVNVNSSEVNAGIVTLVSLPIILTYMASALTGLAWRETCRDAKKKHETWMQ